MVDKLRFERFRNFNEAQFKLTPKTVVIGENGSGKTSLLEAVRLLSVGKSLRSASLNEMMAFGADNFRLTAEFGSNNKKLSAELFYGLPFTGAPLPERQLTVSGQVTEWLNFIGTIPTVLFLPSDTDIVLGGPDVRRRYLDGVLFQVSKSFRADYMELQQALRERSALLFLVKINRAGRDELQPWDEILARLTTSVRTSRQSLVDFISNWLSTQTEGILGKASLVYQFGEADINAVRDQEIKLAQNLFGPHRDELIISFSDRPARRFGSRGQARLFVASLKAAEADFVSITLGQPPVILLDDLFSELDETNSQRALDLFNSDYQLILTATSTVKLAGFEPITLTKASQNA